MHGSPLCLVGLTVIRGRGLRLGLFSCLLIGVRVYPSPPTRQNMEHNIGNSQEDSDP